MVEQSVRLPFRYAVGGAGVFFDELRDHGRLLGSCCGRCRRVACPARAFCVACGEATPATVDVGPAGTLLSWTSLASADYGLVALDGADGALVHRLLGPRDRWRSGLRVHAQLGAHRVGSILDIAGFRAEQP